VCNRGDGLTSMTVFRLEGHFGSRLARREGEHGLLETNPDLDEAVCAAYAHTTGDPACQPDMTDEEISEMLLAVNLTHAGAGA
jgi:hypothetical protein